MRGVVGRCLHEISHTSRNAKSNRNALTALLLGSACLAATPAHSQIAWNGSTSNSWFTPGNWTPGVIPNAAISANINTSATPNAPNIGAAGAAAANVSIGTLASDTGTLTIDGGSLTSGGFNVFLVGDFGKGNLTVSNGGTLSTAITAIGNNAGSTGNATVTGAGSLWTVTTSIFDVGSSGNGTLNVENGGRVNASFVNVGNDNGAVGAINVSGNASRMTVTSSTNIGAAAGSTGSVTVMGPGAIFDGAVLTVGVAGSGTLLAQDGATVNASQLTIGSSALGTATFTGAGTTQVTTNAIRVGLNSGGNGTMNVAAGAVVTSGSGQIGVNTGATGEVNVTGDGSRWTITNSLTIGQAANSGTGSLNVLDGGQVSAFSFTGFNSANVKVDGAGSQLDLPGNAGAITTFTLGATGADNRLDVTNGGALSTKGAVFTPGEDAGVTINVDGSGSTWNATGITMGGAGTTTATFSNNAAVGVVGDFIVDGSDNTSLTITNGAHVTQDPGTSGAGQFRLGVDGHGTLLISNGGVLESLPHDTFATFTFLARNEGSSASATVTGAGSQWIVPGSFIVGSGGDATLDIVAGGSVLGQRSATIANQPGSTAVVTVSGAGSNWLLSEPPPLAGISNINVGLGGNGTLNVLDGGRVAAQGVTVGGAYRDFLAGETTPGTGHLVVSGSDSKLDLNVGSFQTFNIGIDGGTGIVEILNGGQVTVVGQGHVGESVIFDGVQLLGTGTVTVDGANSRLTMTQTFDIGERATGNLIVRNGGYVSNSDGYLGSFTNINGGAGNGTATITGAGSMWVNNGFLRVGDQGAGALSVLDGGLVSNTDAIIANAANSTGTVTVDGAGSTWTNTGSLTIGNLGTAMLTITNGGVVDAADGVAINALSMLNIGTGGDAGILNTPTVANDGLIRFDHADLLTFTTMISGTGALIKDGTGTTILSGESSYTGVTTVNNGVLLVTGSIAASSDLTVKDGATVGGTGTLPTTTVNAGGTLSPGSSIGTISINGNLVLGTGSVYRVEVSPTSADRTNVTGTATLAGEAQLVFGSGSYTANNYTILSAAGGLNGTFNSFTTDGLPVTLSASLSYTATDVLLVTLSSQIAPLLVRPTPNERAVAVAQDQAYNSGLPVIYALYGLSIGQLPAALNALSGEVHASTAGVLVDESRYTRDAVLGRLRQASYGASVDMAPLSVGGPQVSAIGGTDHALAYDKSPVVTKSPLAAPEASRDIVVWAQGFGAWGRFNSDGNAASVKRDLAGFITGVDTRIGADGRVGIATGYIGSQNNLDGRGSSSVETWQVAAYGGWSFGAIKVRAGGAYAFNSIDTDRTIVFPGFADRATAQYNGSTGQVFGELGYGFAYRNVAVEPFVGGAWVRLATDSAAEHGGEAALNVAANSFEVAYSTFGIRAASAIPVGDGMVLVPRAAAAWQHAFNSVTPTAVLAFQNNAVPFVIAGVPIARDSLLVDAGFDLAVNANATFGVSYVGQVAANVHDHAAKGKFNWRF